MWSRRKRLTLIGLIVASAVAGVALEPLLDPLEDGGLAWVGLLVGVTILGGAGGYWFDRRVEKVGDPDERLQSIELRASRLAHGVLLVGVASTAFLLWFPLVEIPVGPALWVLVVASLLVHEAAIEYYRRRM